MSRDAERLKRKLGEILSSRDAEWVKVVSITVNIMYRQFKREQQKKNVIPFDSAKAAVRQSRFIMKDSRKRA
jgi:hypothetical protein